MTHRIELPLVRALVQALGRAEGLDVVRGVAAEDPAALERATLAMNSKIERWERDGGLDIQCVFALREPTEVEEGHYLDDGVYWDNTGVVARGHVLPQASLAQALGGPVRHVVDHALLEGLVVTGIESDDDALVVDAGGCLVGLDELEVLL